MKRFASARLLCAGVGLVALGCLAACVDKQPSPAAKKIDPAYVAKNVLKQAPSTLSTRVDADFGGKVVYLGNELKSGPAIAPGGTIELVHYWNVIEPPGPGWGIFAHVHGSDGGFHNADESDMRAGYPSAQWQAGDIIRDEQTITLPSDWKAKNALVSVGLWKRGGQGIEARMPIVSGPGDSERKVLAATLTVGAAGAPEVPASYVVRRVKGAITVDGKADEAAWSAAPTSSRFVSAEGGPPLSEETRARLLYDDQYLYVFIEAADSDVYSPYTGHDDSLWKADVVELFIDADRNRSGYVELQVNPNNAQFDAWFPVGRGQRSDVLWSADMKSAVKISGTANERSDHDAGWDVELAIPLAAVRGRAGDEMKLAIPPAIGDSWALNIVRVEGAKPGADRVAAAAWSPIRYSDFHGLDRLLTVTFGDADGEIKAPDGAPEEPAPAGEAEKSAPNTEAPSPAAPPAKKPKIDVPRMPPVLKREGTVTPPIYELPKPPDR